MKKKVRTHMGNLVFSEETLAFGLTPLAGKPWKVVSGLLPKCVQPFFLGSHGRMKEFIKSFYF